MPLLILVCAIGLTDNYKTAISLEWFTATFNNINHPTEIRSVQINIWIGATTRLWDRLPEHGDESITKWNALDDALCRPEVRIGDLIIHVESARPLRTDLTDSISPWLHEICLPNAREKYPSDGTRFLATPRRSIVAETPPEEPQEARSDLDEMMEEDENSFQGSSN
ncbi:uncharacterized protein EV420DRAFT_254200 [Desarmillaria tabescens]|uniref:Uncharacterized protein n=1 Tax=Armillaria tabescens TaxID=1929756 RepID=A0AA39KFD6_ARMTA|nr:uncharacterized protein EV420DRAFT_254200 [Desarmillaria tabescens]KAK0460169.1 hypothetical protein EV420DRAFT_254200 [Desarmillaria tabescens]